MLWLYHLQELIQAMTYNNKNCLFVCFSERNTFVTLMCTNQVFLQKYMAIIFVHK